MLFQSEGVSVSRVPVEKCSFDSSCFTLDSNTMHRFNLVFLFLVLHSGRCDDRQSRNGLRKRQSVVEEQQWVADTDADTDFNEQLIIAADAFLRDRDLSETDTCRNSTEMNIPLLPANMQFAAFQSIQKTGTRPLASATMANLTFCLDRIILELSYVLNVGTLVTDLDIDCPHRKAPVHFLDPNVVLPIVEEQQQVSTSSQNFRHRFFVKGKYPGQVHLDNVEVLRILAEGAACQFKVRAYNFQDGLLVGQLKADAFTPVAENNYILSVP